MLKTIVVHLDSGEATSARIMLAGMLAKKHGSRIVGAFAQRAEPKVVGIIVSWPSAEYIKIAADVKEKFKLLTEPDFATEWIDINRGSDEEILKWIACFTRYSDLIIMGRRDPEESELFADYLPEDVSVMSGRPVLIIPNTGKGTQFGLRPLIVWDETAESARAISESLSLIEPNAEVTILSIGVLMSEESKAHRNIERFFVSHGVNARSEIYETTTEGSWQLIQDRIASLGSDLLIVGAHKKGGFPLVACNVVRKESPIPVLMVS